MYNTALLCNFYDFQTDSYHLPCVSDNHVYVWNRKRETPVVVLQGHSRTVNSVCWNPVYHCMIVSASDDCKYNYCCVVVVVLLLLCCYCCVVVVINLSTC